VGADNKSRSNRFLDARSAGDMVTGSPAAFLLVAVVGALVLGSDGETFKVAALALRHPATQVRLRGGFSGEGASTSQLAAYMLCRMGGNDSPTLDDVKACLDSIGAKVVRTSIISSFWFSRHDRCTSC
jgi:hypothetical protein